MEHVANLMVATADLVEAEGRALRNSVRLLVLSVSLVISAVLVGLIGVGFLIFGLFEFMAEQWSTPTAAVLIGGTAVGLAGVLAWIAKRLSS